MEICVPGLSKETTARVSSRKAVLRACPWKAVLRGCPGKAVPRRLNSAPPPLTVMLTITYIGYIVGLKGHTQV